MKKRNILEMAILCCALFVIAGCGSKNQTEDNVTEDNETAAESAHSPLKVCVLEGNKEVLLKKALVEFKKKYPDMEVEVDSIAEEKVDTESSRISTELMAKKGCDLYLDIENVLEDAYKAQEAGAFADLAPLLEKQTEYKQEDFMKGTFDVSEEGKECYMLPVGTSIFMMAVRKDMQEEIGVDVSKWKTGADICDGMEKFYERYPEEQPFIMNESYTFTQDEYGFRIWKGEENAELLKNADLKRGLDLIKKQAYVDGKCIIRNSDSVEEYEKWENEMKKLYNRESIHLGKMIYGASDVKSYIQMGGEQEADLVPGYDMDGNIIGMPRTYAAVAEASSKKEEAAFLLGLILKDTGANGVTEVTLKENNKELFADIRRQYGSGDVIIDSKTYPGLTEATFEKIENWEENQVPYITPSVALNNKYSECFEPYMTDQKSYEECFNDYEKYLEVYYSE